MFMLAIFWAIYSGLTIYGIMKFPAYSASGKASEILWVLVIPILGAYLANRNMGHKIDEAAKADIAFELPWWASTGFRSIGSDVEDD